jgi:hypothetical protein
MSRRSNEWAKTFLVLSVLLSLVAFVWVVFDRVAKRAEIETNYKKWLLENKYSEDELYR